MKLKKLQQKTECGCKIFGSKPTYISKTKYSMNYYCLQTTMVEYMNQKFTQIKRNIDTNHSNNWYTNAKFAKTIVNIQFLDEILQVSINVVRQSKALTNWKKYLLKEKGHQIILCLACTMKRKKFITKKYRTSDYSTACHIFLFLSSPPTSLPQKAQ